MRDRVLIATGRDGLDLFAGISPGVRFTTPRVADYRLGAVLAPFPDEAAARAALEAAGATNIRELGQ